MTTKTASIAFALALCPIPIALAQEALPRPDNAALGYWRAISELPRPSTAEETETREATLELAAEVASGRKPYEAALDDYLASTSSSLKEARRASLLERCDFGHFYEDGPEMLLPHIAPLREIARVALVSARRAESREAWDGAADDGLFVLRLAHHLDQDRVLISSLVATAFASEALDLLARVVDQAPLDSGLAARIEKELASREGRLVDFAAAFRMESRVFGAAFERRSPAEMVDVMHLLGSEAEGEGEKWEALSKSLGVPVETLESPEYWKRGVEEYYEWMGRLVALFEKPYHERQPALDALDDEVASGKPHALVGLLIPASAAASLKEAQLVARLRLVRILAALRTRAGGLTDSLEGLDLPTDPGSGKPFLVRKEGESVLVESVLDQDGERKVGYRLGAR